VGTPQCRPGDQSPIKPRRPVRRARRTAKHSTSHTNAGTVMQNQPAGRRPKHDTEPLCAAFQGEGMGWMRSAPSLPMMRPGCFDG